MKKVEVRTRSGIFTGRDIFIICVAFHGSNKTVQAVYMDLKKKGPREYSAWRREVIEATREALEELEIKFREGPDGDEFQFETLEGAQKALEKIPPGLRQYLTATVRTPVYIPGLF